MTTNRPFTNYFIFSEEDGNLQFLNKNQFYYLPLNMQIGPPKIFPFKFYTGTWNFHHVFNILNGKERVNNSKGVISLTRGSQNSIIM